MFDISVVILTFNSRKYISNCLHSLFDQQIEGAQVIVIDNGSKDGTVDFIKANYPQVELIVNQENLGACKGKNQGIEAALGEWILTLDCDLVLGCGFIKQAMKLARSSSEAVGMIQPKILTNDKQTIFSCGIQRGWLSRFQDIGKGCASTPKFDFTLPVFGACCAAALYRRKMLIEIKDRHGYFDERFFFLFEDADLSWRAQKKGWFCRYYPQLEGFHQGNSSCTDKKNRQILSLRNRRLTILKNQHPVIILLMFPLYLVYDLPRFLILAVKFKFKFPKFGQLNLCTK